MSATNSNVDVGNCILDQNTAAFGAGIFGSGSIFYFVNLTCQNNTATFGGCLYDELGSLFNLTNVSLKNNKANEVGGAISVSIISYAIVQNTVMISNKAKNGGGIHLKQGGFIAFDSTMSNNEAIEHGGSAYLADEESVFCLFGVTLEENTAQWGGFISSLAGGSIELRFNTFDRNSTTISGGAVYIKKTAVEITETKFSANKARAGGALFFVDVSANISNVVFDDDLAIMKKQGDFIVFKEQSYNNVINVSMHHGTASLRGAISMIDSESLASKLLLQIAKLQMKAVRFMELEILLSFVQTVLSSKILQRQRAATYP